VEREGIARTLPTEVGATGVGRSHCVKRLVMLGVAVAACSQPSQPAVPLRAGMSEQQVVEASNNRVPDRVIARTCGNETAAPFPCKIYVYEGAWRGGRYHPKVSVVFEEVRGKWLVSQWL
jgi:hypothetical protein